MRGRANAIPTSESAIATSTVTYRRAPGTFVRRTPRSLVVLAPDSVPVRISGAAVVVWDMLATPKGVGDLLAEVTEQVGVPSSTAATDLAAALETLTGSGAVVVAP